MRHFTKYPSSYVKASFYANDAVPTRDGEWEMWKPATFEKVCELAELGGTKATWDIAYDKMWFDNCNEKGPIYIFVNTATGEKYASCPATKTWFFDENDMNLGKDAFISFLDQHPKFADALGNDGYDYFYVTSDESTGEDFTPRFASDFGDDVEACGDINASTDIEAKRVISKYDSIRDILGEDEWYYIEEYILNGDSGYSFDDVLYNTTAWDDYCDWKMKNFGKKPTISSSTRIRAARYLRGC